MILIIKLVPPALLGCDFIVYSEIKILWDIKYAFYYIY